MPDPAPDQPATAVPLVVVGARAALGAPGDGPARVGSLGEILDLAARLERERHPRWVVPSAARSLGPLVQMGVAVQRVFDVAEAHRLLFGGWAADLPRAFAGAAGLDLTLLPAAPVPRDADLFAGLEDTGLQDAGLVDMGRKDTGLWVESGNGLPGPDSPVRPDGYLRPDVLEPGWAGASDERMSRLALTLGEVARRQSAQLSQVAPAAVGTAHSESAAAVLCLELERDGLPVDRQVAEELIARSAGPRPSGPADAARIRRERDGQVLRHAPEHEGVDLRNPVQVRQLLASVGVVVPTTRAGVLEPYRSVHPLVDALLRWRKDERIATTYGYRWLDEDVGADGRLRGTWTACDGAAGRMTAQHGLHNLPTPLRPAVVAEPGHVFVRADLGQVEPRVLAVVSGDQSLSEATRADDLYAPVAQRLGVERPVAKVAVLAAMYGARSGTAAAALTGLQRAYPVAMRLLDEAYDAGRERRPVRTFGGRLIPLDAVLVGEGTAGGTEGLDAARGRFARNAIIQGSAAELFKAWAATVRHLLGTLEGQIVLCLHDELLVHAPQHRTAQVEALLHESLTDSARRWAGPSAVPVRFVAQTSVVRCWADAKD